MVFSENIALKTKNKEQDSHFLEKQYAWHCTIVQPGESKFAYHLRDDTTHDPSFIHQVLEDILDRWEVRDKTVIIKSDNAQSSIRINDFSNYILHWLRSATFT